jgi:hypothetical protein
MIKHYKLTDNLFKTDYDDIVDKLDKMLKSAVLEEGKTVFFDKNVQTSRNEFKKQYPTNKIVHDLSKADYYISNSTPYPNYYFGYGAQVKASISLNNGWRAENNLKELNKAIDLVNNVGAKFIYPGYIKFKSANSNLPEEMVNKITQMLKSKDQETFQLGWTILFEYDHELCRDQFYLIISKADNMSYYRRKKTRVIEQKLKTIKSFYLNKNF